MPHTPPAAPGDVTRLLESVRAGDQAALDRLFGLLYDELRRIAAARLRHSSDTPSATALVHEVYLKFAGGSPLRAEGRAHFLAIGGPRDLALWSLLMATAHGAGLMVLPLVLGSTEQGTQGAHGAHAAHAGGMTLAGMAGAASAPAVTATLLHSAGYLAATLLLAVLVYERLGIGVLRRAWVNVDLVWAGALIATGVLTVVV